MVLLRDMLNQMGLSITKDTSMKQIKLYIKIYKTLLISKDLKS